MRGGRLVNCNRVEHLLGAYVYDDLEPAERDSVEEHLRQCEECQSNLEALRATVRRIPTDLFLPGEQMRSRVLAQCRGAVDQTENQAAQHSQPMLGNRVVQVTVAALLFFALGIWLGHQISKPAPTATLHSVQRIDGQAPAVDRESVDVGEEAPGDTSVESVVLVTESGAPAPRRTQRKPVAAPVALKAGMVSRVEAPRAGGVDDARLAGSVVAVIE